MDDKLVFDISDKDRDILKKYHKQHDKCPQGMAGEKFVYSFIPSGLGTLVEVKCSCGQTLTLGDFMDNDSQDYDEKEHCILTKEDHKNKSFEKAVLRIMQMKDPRVFRLMFLKDQSFELIYDIAVYGIAPLSDERVGKCILWKYSRGENAALIENYKDLDEKAKIDTFYSYFERNVFEELSKYECTDEKLLNMLRRGS